MKPYDFVKMADGFNKAQLIELGRQYKNRHCLYKNVRLYIAFLKDGVQIGTLIGSTRDIIACRPKEWDTATHFTLTAYLGADRCGNTIDPTTTETFEI